jgi:ureidoglycolate lyase
MPLQARDYLVVVAEGSEPPKPETLRAFRAGGTQGVNYARNLWHHPLLVLEPDSTFLVLDCGNDENNLEEYWFDSGVQIVLEVSTSPVGAEPRVRRV